MTNYKIMGVAVLMLLGVGIQHVARHGP
jgi:hypothetical protein